MCVYMYMCGGGYQGGFDMLAIDEGSQLQIASAALAIRHLGLSLSFALSLFLSFCLCLCLCMNHPNNNNPGNPGNSRVTQVLDRGWLWWGTTCNCLLYKRSNHP